LVLKAAKDIKVIPEARNDDISFQDAQALLDQAENI
jgi:hypothetical protein